MFLDGPRNKGNLINHVNLWRCNDDDFDDDDDNVGSSETSKKASTTTNVLLSKINNKLGVNESRKDLRGAIIAPQAPAALNNERSNNSKSLAAELGLTKLGRSQSIVKNSGRGLRNQGNSVAASSQKVASVRGSLRRTLSLYTSNSATETKRAKEKLGLKFYQVNHERQQASIVKLLEANKRLRCVISDRVAKFDAWLLAHLSLVFILINLFLLAGFTTTLGAPVPRAVLQPIWMGEGLISLDSSPPSQTNDYNLAQDQVEEEEELSLPLPGIADDQWLVQLKVVDPEELALETLGQPHHQPEQLTSGLAGAYEANLNEVNEANEGDSSLGPFEEQVRLQRRRLDRNRALEPPPWLRMQPMRRNGQSYASPLTSSSPTSNQQESVESGSQKQVQYDEASGDQRAARGRQSRESTERAYQELIGQLLEQTFGNEPLLGNLYDELELKYQMANGGSDLKPAATSNKLAGSAINSAGSRGQLLDLMNPNDATLVIVGDEVSSGDDGAPLVSASAINSASSNIGNNQRLIDESAAVDETAAVATNEPASGSGSSSLPSNVKSAAYQAQPQSPVEPQLAGLRLVSLGDQQEQVVGGDSSGAYLQLNPSAQASSFHVVEDIDQADGGQDMRPVLQQQQQQTMNSEDDIDRPALGTDSLYPAKRSPKPMLTSVSRGRHLTNSLQTPGGDVGISSNNKEQLAIMMIEQGLFNQEQLVEAANKLREHLEGVIGLPEATIVGLYPMGERDLLIKLDTSNLNNLQRAYLIKNYNFARGYIVKSWPTDISQQSPVPLLAAILRVLNRDEGSPTKLAGGVQLARADVMLPLESEEIGDAEEQLRAYVIPYYQQQLANSYSSWSPGNFGGDSKTMAAILSYLAANKRPPSLTSLPTSRAEVAEKASKWPQIESGHLQLLALLVAFLVALVLVKLATRPGCDRGHQLKRRLFSLWSTTSGGSGGEEKSQQVEGELSGQAKALEAGEQPPPPAYMSPKEYSSNQFGLLTQRLAQLVSRQTNSGTGLDSGGLNEEQKGAACKSQELDEASTSDLNLNDQSLPLTTTDNEDLETPNGGSGRFRSSRSYIRSLIEALTKSKVAQVVTSSAQQTSREQQVDSDELETLAKQQQQQVASNANANDGANVVSQMDISAAHLILDYMEKHLEDKERLRREWLELNAGSQQQQPKITTAKSPGKTNNANLHKLARVGLSDENKAKNRNNQVVPFDKNRVRLGLKHGCSDLIPATEASKTANSKQDYINASYIYDDDLRRPTHIIAQGPLDELAAAHFWQMVWEQGVSVVVALTRLNENSIRMCHCYWPTTTTRGSLLELSKDDTVSGPKGVVSPPLDSPNGDSNGRRASVTSVLNGNGPGGTVGGAHHQPFVAPNGDNQNNILCFQVTSCGETMKLEVHLVSEHVSSQDYLVRNMYLVNRTSGETRTITQFHYLAWAESGVPTNVKSFLEFRRKVHKSYRNLSNPILVHCSDGGGRSGTYTLIDIILERIKNGAKEIDPRATLEHLRDQRAGLCASQGQFEFVLMALAEEIQIILNALPH